MKSLELFTGAGGLAIGTHLAGFHHVGLVEFETNAQNTIARNAKEKSLKGIGHWQDILHGDVRGVDFKGFQNVDLVAGGPPCQPFSIGGKHKGMNDTRDMIPQFIRAVREVKPRAFIMENVKGLMRQSFSTYFSYALLRMTYPEMVLKEGETWVEHLSRLEDTHTSGCYDGLKYNVVFRLLNAANYGIPQTRERVFFVGFRSDLKKEYHFPEYTHSQDALLYDQWVSGAYWKRNNLEAVGEVPKRYQGRVKRLRLASEKPNSKPWVTVRNAILDLPDPRAVKEVVNHHKYQPGAKVYPGHTGSPYDWPSKTLKSGVHGVPGGENMIAFHDGSVRYFTVREAARMQTFPDSWQFEGSWSENMRQLGNAVPVELGAVVAKSVHALLKE